MIWFSGTISSAVDKVKSSSSLLLVFVQGEDDLSRKYEKFLNEETKLKSENFIAIKISNNSVALEQFKQIYTTVPIPSVFLIGGNGIPLAVCCSKNPEDLVNIINEAVAKYKKGNNAENETSQSQDNKIPLHNAENENKPQVNSTDEKNNIDCNRYEFLLQDKNLRYEPTVICPTFFLFETHPSCDRNDSSQKVQSGKSPYNPIRFLYHKSVDSAMTDAGRRIYAMMEVVFFSSTVARIRFCLPTQETRSWEFPNMCTLHDVHLYLMETMKLSPGFKLLRTYPRVAFTPEDEGKTLVDLSLTPNATLIVVPGQDSSIQGKIKKMIMKKNLLFTLFTTIFQPIFTIFSYIRGLIMKPPGQRIERPKKRDNRQYSVHRRVTKKTSTNNVHGFSFEESDTDSDMNTDNGNSTQQK